ncbi:MAG TPA: enolase C-terminal domain-like protein [Mycobacteriales bacterium]|jgi:L-alanine-DL-glutamate epimerase-like enolase superfamily enzyme|nr:enolase C-terminal domain-like protein [Mycobacteriales bacterium]
MTAEPTVTSVKVQTRTVPTDLPEADGTLAWDSTTVVIVEVQAGDMVGLGWTYTAAAAAHVIDQVLSPVVVGHSALDPPGLNEAMGRAVRNIGRTGLVAAAISAVDIATWDLKARLLGQSVVGLIASTDDPIAIYGSGGFTTYDDDQTTRQVEGWLADAGVRQVKIKIGESWGARVERDLARAELVRDLIGDRELFVDANGGYSIGQAKRVGRALDDLGVTWFEEPVSSDDLDGLRLLRRHVVADVAAGEYGDSPAYFRRMLAAQAVDCLQIDVTRCGGITAFIRSAAIAAAQNMAVSAHCAPHLHASFVAAVPNLRHVEYFHDHARIEEEIVFAGAEKPRNGHLKSRRDCVGHGMSLRAGSSAADRG